jgi:alpha-galactosidase
MSKSIEFDAARRVFMLRAGQFSYAFGVGKSGHLTHLHWGERIDRIADLPDPAEVTCYRHCKPRRLEVTRQEYPAWGGEFYGEPALKADFPNGVRGAQLFYKSCEIRNDDGADELIVTLQDTGYPLEVRLHYRVFADVDVIERWSEIANLGTETVTLRSAMSGSLQLPRLNRDYRLSHLSGRWGKENTIERLPVTQSKTVLESRTGLSGSRATPFFALDEGSADEHSGLVWFGALHWSGNWKIAVERDPYDNVSACGGINDFDFSWPLKAGEVFTTPLFCAGVSIEGFNGMSQTMHRYQRRHVLPKETLEQPMPVIFNSWASMGADVDEEKILGVAEKAAEIGAELFVIDDGWQSFLGDWTPDPHKFPCGLKPVVEKVKALGMDFGLWVEIESFEMKSRLFQEHPDWAMTYPGRECFRNHRPDVDRISMLLNFARDEVAEYMYQALRTLFQETGIRYLKLDMNYFFSTPGWAEAAPEEQQTIWVKYVRNLHGIFSRLHAEFPEVMMENCASGAGRPDLAMSRYFSRINRSDNQDTLDILRLHEGFTWVQPTRLAGGACHISDAIYGVNLRRTPLQYQAFAGMMGSLAVGKNLLTCPAAEQEDIRGYVELHKRLRHIPHFGEMTRLASQREHPYAAFEYVSEDRKEALLFVFGHSIQFASKVPAFKLKGLDPDTVYAIECFGNNPQGGYSASITDYQPVSGRGLMALGARVELLGDYDARILYFRAGD